MPKRSKEITSKQKTPLATRWIMCATSESCDHYCCCASWDHEPSQAEIDLVRVSLDSHDLEENHGEKEGEFTVVVDGLKYNTYVPTWTISKIKV